MERFLAVALGGLIGSSLRYAVTSWAMRRFGQAFPWGTAIVNIVGCFLIGYLLPKGPEQSTLGLGGRLFLVTGLLGGLTTFSSFAFESVRLVQVGSPLSALANLSINLVLGLSTVWLGMRVGRP